MQKTPAAEHNPDMARISAGLKKNEVAHTQLPGVNPGTRPHLLIGGAGQLYPEAIAVNEHHKSGTVHPLLRDTAKPVRGTPPLLELLHQPLFNLPRIGAGPRRRTASP